MSLVLFGNFKLETGQSLESIVLKIESFRMERYTGYFIAIPAFYKNTSDSFFLKPELKINKKIFLDGSKFVDPDFFNIKMVSPVTSEDGSVRNKIDTSVVGDNPLSWAYSQIEKIILEDNPGIKNVVEA